MPKFAKVFNRLYINAGPGSSLEKDTQFRNSKSSSNIYIQIYIENNMANKQDREQAAAKKVLTCALITPIYTRLRTAYVCVFVFLIPYMLLPQIRGRL